MSEPSDSDLKWKCRYCTYENFPSSIRCTMCREAREKTFGSCNSGSDDIYQIAAAASAGPSEQTTHLTNDIDSINLENKKKTSTYLYSESKSSSNQRSPCLHNERDDMASSNKHHLHTSKQQHILNNTTAVSNSHILNSTVTKPSHYHHQSNQRLSPSSISASNLHEHLHPLKLTDDRSSPDGGVHAGRGGRMDVSPPRNRRPDVGSGGGLSPPLLPASRTSGGVSPPRSSEPCVGDELGGSGGVMTTSTAKKWCCTRCTYENWPKASKCVMCNGSPRISPLPSSPSPTAVSDVERDNSAVALAAAAKCVSEERDRHDRRSVTRERRCEESNVFLQSHKQHNQNNNNYEMERRLRAHRQLQRSADWAWLNACLGIVQGDYAPVHSYLSCGGNPARQLTTPEVALLNRPSAFDVGHTLVHLAIRFQREDILATLLSQIEGSGGSGVKRVPSYVAPDLAADIRRQVANTIRQRKASLPCPFVTDITTFTLPAEIEDLPPSIQEQLFEELLDKDAQQQLESEPHPVINWSLEVTVHLSSRLYALWNRSAGDCLLDSLMQTTWGVFDRENVLRRALSDSLNQAGHLFYPRWKEYEDMQATLLDFSLDEAQWEDDWTSLVSLASQPGAALEQLHVFALAHILRRPIIVYGVKYVKSFRGEDIGYARFEGVYLPLLWEPSFCSRSPLSLGYTRGHFSALIPIEPYTGRHHPRGGGARNIVANENQVQVTFLPLMDHERKLLPIHFVTHNEMGREENLLKQWLDVGVTESGLLVAQQRLSKPPLLVAQMVEEWLNHYRRLQQMSTAPFCRPIRVQDFSSDESDGDE